MAPAPRPSHSAEAARAAAAQAEFNEKKWVWVPDDKEGYLAGWVVREEGDAGEVVMASGGEVRVKPRPVEMKRVNVCSFRSDIVLCARFDASHSMLYQR